MGEAEIIPIDARSRTDGSRERRPRQRCRATTASGKPCRNYAVGTRGYCRVHASRDQALSRHPAGSKAEENDSDPRPTGEYPSAAELVDFARRRLAGDYPIDDFGYDEDLARTLLLPLAKPLFDNYFRVKTLGVDRIPNEGPALLVANHSGTIPVDAVMIQYAVATQHPEQRVVRNVAATLAMSMPFVGPLARKTGNVVACNEDAYELLRRGEVVGVFPEGFKGVGKGWRERYRLQRFGRGGFIEVALRAKVPIIPTAVVGAEEAYPMIADARLVAKAFGLPYFPITPTFPLLGPLGALPLPSRWVIEFGDPISMDEYPDDAADDAMLVFDLTDGIRDTIQQMLYKNLRARGSAFF